MAEKTRHNEQKPPTGFQGQYANWDKEKYEYDL